MNEIRFVPTVSSNSLRVTFNANIPVTIKHAQINLDITAVLYVYFVTGSI